jgi:hypothetical protein
MKDLDTIQHHKISEELAQILCQKTQNTNPLFFRILVGYYWCKLASFMRCDIQTKDRGVIPVNMYALNLATSGYGKGLSTNVMEEQVISLFRERFLEETLPAITAVSLPNLACKRASKKGLQDPDSEILKTEKEFENAGTMVFSFDSATPAAVKQLRHKLLMAGAGSLNLEIDEIGSNLLGNADVLNTFLELYDVGRIKQKLTKNTVENTRAEEIDGRTPTNAMLYGTPAKLFDGSRTEAELNTFLDIGYGRRCFFGYTKENKKKAKLTAQEVLDLMTNTTTDQFLTDLAQQLYDLADMMHFNKKLLVDKNVTLLYIEYKLYCEALAENLPEHDEIRKAEISHRYFKALKLAGAYAFIDGMPEITEDHLYAAIKLAEESGKSFEQMMSRDRPYVKLAKYVASVNQDLTQADLVEDLPYYRGSAAQKSELMSLAIAYGYKNNIILKRSYVDGIEFIRGESLKETDTNKILLSYSGDFAKDYKPVCRPFNQLKKFVQVSGLHFCNHSFIDEHRNENNAIPHFNMIILDVDKGANIALAKQVFADYTYLIYTTKRHNENNNGVDRFRILVPMSHELKLTAVEYNEFMQNVFQSLPFDTDEQTAQRSRKWMTHGGSELHYNEGKLFDILPFIPKTAKNDERKSKFEGQTDFNNLERWFINNTGEGNRSNQLFKYASMLCDTGMPILGIKNAVTALNGKLPNALSLSELSNTIFKSVEKLVHKRENP